MCRLSRPRGWGCWREWLLQTSEHPGVRQLSGIRPGRCAHVVLLRQQLAVRSLWEERDVHRNAAELPWRTTSANDGNVWSCVGNTGGGSTMPCRNQVKPTAGPATADTSTTTAATIATIAAAMVYNTGRGASLLSQSRHQVC